MSRGKGGGVHLVSHYVLGYSGLFSLRFPLASKTVAEIEIP
jgi:hypothetical protein